MKTKRGSKSRMVVAVRQKQTLHYIIIGTILALIGGISLFFYLNTGTADDTHAAAASDFTTSSGFWDDNTLWNSGTFPGTVNISKNIEIFKNITSYDAADPEMTLSFKSNLTLTITDTLVVRGNLTLDNNSELIIGANGVLVVTGDLTADNKLAIASGGVIAVGRDADFGNNLSYDDGGGGELFILGDPGDLAGANDGGETELRDRGYEDILNILLGNTVALPIVLLHFDATVQQQSVILTWATESEIDNDFFTIERSRDGHAVESVGTLPGAGTSQTVRQYSFVEEHPQPGISYYRLRQTDYNGQTEAFNWVAVTMEQVLPAEPALAISQVFPNPFVDECHITFTSTHSGLVAVDLMDMQGTTVTSAVTKGYVGENQYALNNLQNLRPGTYLLRLSRNGTISKTHRILKK